MTNEEAINYLQSLLKKQNINRGDGASIGVIPPIAVGHEQEVNMAIEALEYREPMKMIQEEDTAHRLYCGNCHAYFGIYGDILLPSGSKHCYKCGQAMDWRD